MNIRLVIKKYIPRKLLNPIIKLNKYAEGITICNSDFKRFMKYYSDQSEKMNKSQIETRLNFYSHSLEKGLSHDEIRYGFGKTALEQLARSMSIYNNKSLNKNDISYKNALSVLREYIRIHKAEKFDISYLDKMFSKNIIHDIGMCNSEIGGSTTVLIDSKYKNNEKNFKDLFLGRSSVRTYSEDEVNIDKIKNAIELSMKSPSVCNRQSSRVYVISDKKYIENTLKLQGGMGGYPTPPILLAVTSSISGFVNITERNQPYIDGGLFSMALLLSIENEGLAACPLNAMFNIKTESKIRSIINIKPDENIIMLIAVGNFKEVNNIAKSFRYSGDSITTFIK